jgi:hypothetical protein
MMKSLVRAASAAALLCMAAPASAQLNGENLLGDTGVKNGTQPGPGWYVAGVYVFYDTDTIKRSDGSTLSLDPSQPGRQKLHAFAPAIIYVSHAKLLGANYGFMVVPPFANASLEAPGIGFSGELETGPADLYVLPLTLGWHLPRADVNAAAGFFAPTGRFTSGADDNIGKGMWSVELSAGTTIYLDEQKSVSVATSAFWESHTEKEGSEILVGNTRLTGVKVGQLLTLEGGVGKSFLQGAMSLGVAYYAQWKLTHDEFGGPLDPERLGKHRVYAVGPDVTIPLATKSTLIALVNVRYFWETGSRVKTEGQSLVVTATFPVPSVKIK